MKYSASQRVNCNIYLIYLTQLTLLPWCLFSVLLMLSGTTGLNATHSKLLPGE